MSQLEELREIREKIDNNTCTISDLENIYDKVHTNVEVIAAQKDDIAHLYYRDHKKGTVKLEEKLIPYEKKILYTHEPMMYPFDLCNIIFYDATTNRYGQGIIIPRIKKLVIVDDMDLIKQPIVGSFITAGIRENNEECASIVDLKGNLYRIYGYDENDENFTSNELEIFTFPSCLYQKYGILVNYNNRPVYAEIKEFPYLILNSKTLQKCGDKIRNINDYVERFDDNFMQGKKSCRKRRLNKS